MVSTVDAVKARESRPGRNDPRPWLVMMVCLLAAAPAARSQQNVSLAEQAGKAVPASANLQVSFRVEAVDGNAITLAGGAAAGLAKGMTLMVKHHGVMATESGAGEMTATVIAGQVEVTSVDASVALCRVTSMSSKIRSGDTAWVAQEDLEQLARNRANPAVAPAAASAPPLPPMSGATAPMRSAVIRPPWSWGSRRKIPPPEPAAKPVPTEFPEENSGMQPAAGPAPAPSVASAPAATANLPGAGSGTQPASPAKPNSIPVVVATAPAAISTPAVVPALATQTQPSSNAGVASAPDAAPQPTVQELVQRTYQVSARYEGSAAEQIARTAEFHPLYPLQDATPPEPSPQPQSSAPAASEGQPETVAANLPGPAAARPEMPKSAVPLWPSAPAAQEQGSAPAEAQTTAAILPNPGATPAGAAAAAEIPPKLNVQTSFKVKYVAAGAVYLVGGRSTGLAEGMKLVVNRSADAVTQAVGSEPDAPGVIAHLEILSVADSSAVAQIASSTADVKPGDLAYLEKDEALALAQKLSTDSNRKYPQTITFTEGDPMEEEARAEVPRPPSPAVNRARGMIGFNYSGIRSSGGGNSYELGGMFRSDITRIAGTYWNLSGYWSGLFNNASYNGVQTMQDLINRTYHLELSYQNPNSRWVAGFGRLYLPWAASLDTLDGGYLGRRIGRHVTAGVFAGSTPDPTSWNYNPDQRLAGTFLNFEGGDYSGFHYTSTSGVGVSTLLWVAERPFIFFENSFSYKAVFSVYDSTQADDPRPVPGAPAAGPGLSRHYLAIRYTPEKHITFDINHNYFRDIPTFNQVLIATGLLDNYLFQGINGGVEVKPIKLITLSATVGKSSRTGDPKSSWDELYGLTLNRIWRTGLQADFRYSKFNSSFGSGDYRSVTLSRNLGTLVRGEVQLGQQSLVSAFTSQPNSHFVYSDLQVFLGRHYFLQGGYTVQRGAQFNYDQWLMTLGFRFDNRKGHAQ